MTTGMPSWVREHLGVVLTLATGVAISIRVLSSAALDPETALILLEAQGTAAVILGSLLPVLPLLPGLASVFALIATFGSRPISRTRLATALVLLGVSAVMVPLGSVALLLVLPTVIVALYAARLSWSVCQLRTARRERDRAKVHDAVEAVRYLNAVRLGAGNYGSPRFIFLISSVTVSLVLFSAPPWLPTESIRAGGDPFTGYVLGSDDEMLIILKDSPRTAIRIPKANVQRSYCTKPDEDEGTSLSRLASSGTPLLFQLSSTTPRARGYPPCPETES
jgi:hypothetical protein